MKQTWCQNYFFWNETNLCIICQAQQIYLVLWSDSLNNILYNKKNKKWI